MIDNSDFNKDLIRNDNFNRKKSQINSNSNLKYRP